MARRRQKRRTQPRSSDKNSTANDVPRSFVIKHGAVGSSVTQLVRDLRRVMEPNTATKLRVSAVFFSHKDILIDKIILMKERSRNKLKDYIVLGPTLHVSHLLAVTLTEVAPTLRLIRLPSGPTLAFRIERYSLTKDIMHTTRRAKGKGLEYLSPPLVSLGLACALQWNSALSTARVCIFPTSWSRNTTSLISHPEIVSIALSSPVT